MHTSTCIHFVHYNICKARLSLLHVAATSVMLKTLTANLHDASIKEQCSDKRKNNHVCIQVGPKWMHKATDIRACVIKYASVVGLRGRP